MDLMEFVSSFAPDSVKQSIRQIGTADVDKKYLKKEKERRERQLKNEPKKRNRVAIKKEIHKLDSMDRERKLAKEKQSRSPPKLVDWEKSQYGTLSGWVYGSRHVRDGEFVKTKVIVSGKAKNGNIVRTRDGRAYLLCKDL
mmetsp:Transcript_14943/g.28635  ORF Transcript_14943/g.28635 Transcript_14943/m.28635 type:complete len:141 (-) Transcript_14943:52-474(-)|eukprot:CAMPEP_0197457118 /NCGR_PEP_ID=MMETSP1175-20131217/45159_1 /TAXON_ID=1003142 /ORGANISM="Triceratium dubium, Strain CCMP147" /LENGTH=140 /DNA_ID=CAMNT_0042991381 /DNA_START=130 /DNA_END=552 /DNA_ORIENTATION=-